MIHVAIVIEGTTKLRTQFPRSSDVVEVIICSIKGYRNCINVEAPISTSSLKDYLVPLIVIYWCRCTTREYDRIVT